VACFEIKFQQEYIWSNTHILLYYLNTFTFIYMNYVNCKMYFPTKRSVAATITAFKCWSNLELLILVEEYAPMSSSSWPELKSL
jgi:hypothetical protein